MLCGPCNSTLTKPDHAYQQFSDWAFASAATLHERDAIDYVAIFGAAYREKALLGVICNGGRAPRGLTRAAIISVGSRQLEALRTAP
jgi:hypothetical protein